MNNLFLGNYPLVKLSLSVFILMGVSAASKADTLYGPLKAGETLSSIVNENYLVSPFEDAVIMREIFRLNPQAFIYNNMGLVKQGVMLTLPSDTTIRRSRAPSSSNTIVPAVTTPIQASPNTSSITSSLNETLTQVRNERDQAKLKLRRFQTESTAQTDALNARIEQLDSDNQSTTRQLNTAQTEITQLKQSLETRRKENALLATKAQSVPVSTNVSDEIVKQLKEGELLLAEKQQQISELETEVAELKTNAESISSSHDAAVMELRSEYRALESKFDQQIQTTASEVNKSATDSTVKIDELNLQHQQALVDLKVDFDKRSADQNSLRLTLESEIKEANSVIDTTGIELTDLRSKNSALDLALSSSKAEIESLVSFKSEAEVTPKTITLTQTDTIETLLKGPITNQLLIEELDKPVAFPLWGLLLGSFALGFTSLMMLFTRNRKPVVQVTQNTAELQTDDKKEDLVFRAADENALDETDIETLRVPPRRDPSRVAILDPSMVASAAVAVASSTSFPTVDPEAEETAKATPLTPHQATEFKLKLLLAETYAEINDIPAANEMLDEVQQQGDSEYRLTAGKLQTQINQK